MKKLFVPTLASLAPKEHTTIFADTPRGTRNLRIHKRGGHLSFSFEIKDFTKTGMKQNKPWGPGLSQRGGKKKKVGNLNISTRNKIIPGAESP